ncbi:MAG: glycosyltransferase [Proteobacteria bacterium]|nr:glycosyltransferase [Pseudomonadota bacterium]
MNKATILFLDNTYPKAYQVSTLKDQAIGGTESSIVKTAMLLSQKHKVFVAQKSRKTTYIESLNLSFIPKNDIDQLNPDFVVVLRKHPLLKKLSKQFPQAKLFLWLHTYKNTEYAFKRLSLAKTNATIICNSQTHAQHTNEILNNSLLGRLFSLFSKKTKVTYCYNPIIKPRQKNLDRNINKLIFFSSPNKGLAQVVKTFNTINKQLPDLRLYIANPGYKNDESITLNKNINTLGSLPHQQMMDEVATSLCVFYPQDSFAETFGLIYAEANALGTPVLAHDIGAAREILHRNNNLIDAKDSEQILNTVRAWQKQLPIVEYKQNFNDESVFEQWNSLLK